MCELLGISAGGPVTARQELSEFRLRGGLAADNPDGWGVAWWQEGEIRLAKEPQPACESSRFAALSGEVSSHLIIAHVRKANFPPVNTLNNTHPFQRDCCGKGWVFAHNGLVPEIVDIEQGKPCPICQPGGDTDSEYAFCHLLGHISTNYASASRMETPDSFATLAAASKQIAAHGKFNFLLSDGEYLIAYGHDRLHYLEAGAGPDIRAVVATEPLPMGAGWISFEPGELRIYRAGTLVEQMLTRPPQATIPAGGRGTVQS